MRITIVIVALAVGLAVLLGGQWAYNKFIYHDPLDQVLEETGLVEDYSVDYDGDVLVVRVKLNPADNFMEKYQELDNTVCRVMNQRGYRIEIVDNPDHELEKAYYNSQFVIYEAITKGNFREMANIVHDNAGKVGGRARIYVGPHNVYLQMDRGECHLFKVIPRSIGGSMEGAGNLD